MSTLKEFIDKADCVQLRDEVLKFLHLIRHSVIVSYECPVCHEDLRETYNPHQTNPGRGNCAMCKLGIQMIHRVSHEGHPGCSVDLTYPVALADAELRRRLRSAWVKMHGESLLSRKLLLQVEQKWDQTRWVNAALEIQERYDTERRPKG